MEADLKEKETEGVREIERERAREKERGYRMDTYLKVRKG